MEDYQDSIAFCSALYDTDLFVDPKDNYASDERTYQAAGFACLSLVVVGALYYWLGSRTRLLGQGKVDQANKQYIYVYRNLIIIYVIIVMIQLFICILNVVLNETQPQFSSSQWQWYDVISGAIFTISPNTQMGMLAFLYTKNTISYKAFQHGYRFSIPFTLVWLTAFIVSMDSSVSNKGQTWARILIDGAFLFFCFYIVFRQCQYHWKRRPIVLRYICTVMAIVSFDLIQWIYTLNERDASCIAQMGFYIWVLIYPFIFFITVKADSDFWWTDASQPLMESTQESLQGLNLFNLHGYRDIHFDKKEDHELRFKKLKQIVSGYVPLIPFKKIKWNDDSTVPEEDESSMETGTTTEDTTADNELVTTPSPMTHVKDQSKTHGATPSPANNYNNHNQNNNNDKHKKTTEASASSKSKDTKESENNNNNNDDEKQEKKKLGGGSTGVVFRGTYGKQQVAVKELTRLDKKTEMSWTDLTLIFRESILNSSLSHPNIVQFIGASLTYNAFYLVYEYCEYGDLQQIVVENSHSENQKLTCIKQRYWYMIDICKGMMFLHSNNFVHRDLKTANVVVTWNNKVKRYIGKICDFGVSRKLPKDQQDIQNINNSLLSNDSDFSKLLSQHGGSNNNNNMNGNYYNNNKGNGSNLGLPGDMSKSPTSDENSVTGYEASTTTINAAGQFQPNIPFTTKEIERTIHVGTPAFLAPEILLKLVKSKGVNLRKKKKKRKGTAEQGTLADHNVDPMIYCDFATDVYSFGMLMWSLITAKLPYKGFKPLDMIKMIYNGDRLKISKREWQLWADEAHIDVNSLKSLLNICWAQYPQDRPTFIQIDAILFDILTTAESDPDGAGIWPSTDNGAVLVKSHFDGKEYSGGSGGGSGGGGGLFGSSVNRDHAIN